MKTKLLIFAILIAMLFSACEQPPVQSTAPSAAELTAPPYKVFLSGDTENGQLFTADAETFSATEKNSFSNVPKQIMLMLPARGTYLNYYSTGVNAHQYRSEEDSVRCQLNINTGALSFLTVTDFSLLPDFVCKDAASFESSVKKLISLYYPEEDWSKYTVRCTTSKILFSEDYTEAKSFDGFLTAENQNEQVSGYTLVFNRIIDGLPVDDYIEVRLSEVALMVRFSPHKFDAIDSIALNTEHLNASIDAFLNASLDKSKYTLQDYALSAPTIVRIGDQLYYSAYATLEVQPVNGTAGNLIYTVPLITDIEINVADAGISAPVKPYRIVTDEPATQTQPTGTQATTESSAEQITGDNGEGHHVPPHCLEFTDLREVSNLFSAVEMEKEELESYLSSKNYDMNGIYTKDHIVVLEKTASRIPYPSLTGGALEIFHIYPDDYAFFVRYSLEHGCVQVKVRTDSYPAKEEDIQIETTLSEKLASCNQDVLYYCNSDQTPQGVPRLAYGAIVDGYYVSFLVFDMPREEADEIVKSVTFDPLAEILKNHSTGNQNGE